MAALEALVEALRRLPGVGVKSAQRMAYHLLQHDRPGAQQLSQALSQAVQRVGHCRACNTFAETELCVTCADPSRDPRQLCVVETPADQAVLERSGHFKGRYFVLLGRLSPLDGVGVESLGVDKLLGRLDEQGLEEIILATSFTAEGEATAHVLTQLMQARGLKVTRLARGVPAGSEIEYVDPGTLAHALADRR